jgi:hypothetical protein
MVPSTYVPKTQSASRYPARFGTDIRHAHQSGCASSIGLRYNDQTVGRNDDDASIAITFKTRIVLKFAMRMPMLRLTELVERAHS